MVEVLLVLTVAVAAFGAYRNWRVQFDADPTGNQSDRLRTQDGIVESRPQPASLPQLH